LIPPQIGSAIDDSRDDNAMGKKKPSPRRVVQEGIMAKSGRHQEVRGVKVSPRLHGQWDQL